MRLSFLFALLELCYSIAYTRHFDHVNHTETLVVSVHSLSFIRTLLLFCAIYGSKIIHSNGALFYPMFPNCVHVKRRSFTFLNVKFFPPNCSKFAVEFDWNGKISQNVQNLGLSEKWSSKDLEFFSKLLNVANFL